MKKKRPTEEIREYLRTQFKTKFKGYYIGDPIQIPQISLPCVVIEPVSENPTQGPTGMDDITEVIRIKVVVNKKDDYGRKASDVLWLQRLEDMVSSRDETTNEYLEDTFMGVLRKNLTLGNRFYSSEFTVTYGLQPRPQDMVTEEAEIIVTLKERVAVTGRA